MLLDLREHCVWLASQAYTFRQSNRYFQISRVEDKNSFSKNKRFIFRILRSTLRSDTRVDRKIVCFCLCLFRANAVAEWLERVVLVCEVTCSIPRITSEIFLKGSVRSLVQANHKLPNRPTNLAITLVVITKEISLL